jgi:hypothetical protein
LAQSFRKLVSDASRNVRKRPRAGSALEKASRCMSVVRKLCTMSFEVSLS